MENIWELCKHIGIDIKLEWNREQKKSNSQPTSIVCICVNAPFGTLEFLKR